MGRRYDAARKMVVEGDIRPLHIASTSHVGLALGLIWERHSATVMTMQNGEARAQRTSYNTFGVGLRAGFGSRYGSWAKQDAPRTTVEESQRVANTAIDATDASKGWSALPMGYVSKMWPHPKPARGPALTFSTRDKTSRAAVWYPAANDGKRTTLLEAIDNGTEAVNRAREAIAAGDAKLAAMHINSFAWHEARTKDAMDTIENYSLQARWK